MSESSEQWPRSPQFPLPGLLLAYHIFTDGGRSCQHRCRGKLAIVLLLLIKRLGAKFRIRLWIFAHDPGHFIVYEHLASLTFRWYAASLSRSVMSCPACRRFTGACIIVCSRPRSHAPLLVARSSARAT